MQFLSGYSVILPKATSVCKWLALPVLVLMVGCTTHSSVRVQRVEGIGCERLSVEYETDRNRMEAEPILNIKN